MLLTPTEINIVTSVVERFLNLGEPTPRRGLLLKAQSIELLDKLNRWSILRLHDNKEFLPLALAFHFCANSESSALAKRSVTIVGHVLRNLFENDLSDETRHNSEDVMRHARDMYETVEGKEVQLGLYLGYEFGLFASYAGNQTHTQVTFLTISERIIEINPDTLWDDYIKRQTQWIEGQLGKDSNPFPDAEAEVEGAPAEVPSADGPGRYAGWEIIKSLSKNTGQSEVFLVRNPQRVASARKLRGRSKYMRVN